jgi:iron-sulfur cluster repair protein YtfE (RIC family)
MKRSPELRDLSEQHHHGLVAARRLRQAAGETPLPEAVAGFLRDWYREIQPHFRVEEEILLPEFAGAVGEGDPLIVRTLSEHVALRQAVRKLAGSAGEPLRSLAGTIGQSLDDHIRFEERVLFPAVEAALKGQALVQLGDELQGVNGTPSRKPLGTDDPPASRVPVRWGRE